MVRQVREVTSRHRAFRELLGGGAQVKRLQEKPEKYAAGLK